MVFSHYSLYIRVKYRLKKTTLEEIDCEERRAEGAELRAQGFTKDKR